MGGWQKMLSMSQTNKFTNSLRKLVSDTYNVVIKRFRFIPFHIFDFASRCCKFVMHATYHSLSGRKLSALSI